MLIHKGQKLAHSWFILTIKCSIGVIAYVLLLSLVVNMSSSYAVSYINARYNPYGISINYKIDTNNSFQDNTQIMPKQVIAEYIITQATIHNIDVATALRIAICESGLNNQARASDTFGKGATAKGVYQFIDATWQRLNPNNHVFDYQANVDTFMDYYPTHKSEWSCK